MNPCSDLCPFTACLACVWRGGINPTEEKQ